MLETVLSHVNCIYGEGRQGGELDWEGEREAGGVKQGGGREAGRVEA